MQMLFISICIIGIIIFLVILMDSNDFCANLISETIINFGIILAVVAVVLFLLLPFLPLLPFSSETTIGDSGESITVNEEVIM